MALTTLLPGQALPWLIRAADGDAIAYLNIEETDTIFICPAVTADVSGRHYNEDRTVIVILARLQEKIGGTINCYP